jgi:hypothetical protein
VFKYAVCDSKDGAPDGLEATAPVASDDAVAEATELDAVTETRTVLPASVLAIV